MSGLTVALPDGSVATVESTGHNSSIISRAVDGETVWGQVFATGPREDHEAQVADVLAAMAERPQAVHPVVGRPMSARRHEGRVGARAEVVETTDQAYGEHTFVAPSKAGPAVLPSERFMGGETLTPGEWQRRHDATYGGAAA